MRQDTVGSFSGDDSYISFCLYLRGRACTLRAILTVPREAGEVGEVSTVIVPVWQGHGTSEVGRIRRVTQMLCSSVG